jgi:hypothetical protein
MVGRTAEILLLAIRSKYERTSPDCQVERRRGEEKRRECRTVELVEMY